MPVGLPHVAGFSVNERAYLSPIFEAAGLAQLKLPRPNWLGVRLWQEGILGFGQRLLWVKSGHSPIRPMSALPPKADIEARMSRQVDFQNC
jgi:hypothetical protein